MTPETLHRKVAEFEAALDYDASYQHDLIDAAPEAAAIFATVPMLVDRKAAPAEALAAAAMAAVLVEDCGPCAQVGLDIAARSGADPAVLRAIVEGDEAAMGEETALAWRFARAVVAHDETTAAPARREIMHRWGSAGLMAVSLSIATTKIYPTMKYALGYGHPIDTLKVGGVALTPGGRPARAA